MPYLYFIWKSHRSFLLFSMVFVSLFQFLILRLVTTVDTSTLVLVLDQIPENIRNLLGEDFVSMLTVKGAVALGMNHPLVLVILSIAAIIIPSRHIAGEIETGTLELILSFPVKRVRLLLNLYISAIFFLFLIIFCALCASLISIHIFHPLTSDLFIKVVMIGANFWLLFLFIMSLTTVFSVFEKEANKVGMKVAGIVLIFYLLHYLSSIWDAIKFTKPFNIFNYYRPVDLINGERSFLLHSIVLISLILLCLFISIYQFNRRDIPG